MIMGCLMGMEGVSEPGRTMLLNQEDHQIAIENNVQTINTGA